MLNIGTLVGQGFSNELSVYADQPTAARKSVETIYNLTLSPQYPINSSDAQIRKEIIQMYKDFGIDISLGYQELYSSELVSLLPSNFSHTTPLPLSGTYPLPFSIDAPFYHPIPSDSPRTLLPKGYFLGAQFSTVHGFDGLGLGVTISSPADPLLNLSSSVDSKKYTLHISRNASNQLPTNPSGDQHLCFIDTTTNTVFSTEKAAMDGINWKADYVASIKLGTLGCQGGTVATGTSDLAILIRPGEATNPNAPIKHAVGGALRRMWKARVFPAVSIDTWMFKDQKISTYTGDGLIPYGAVIQLDPSVNLTKFSISLPARRVLEAIQTYGYYNIDTGGPGILFYTATDADEYLPHYVQDIQNEIFSVLNVSNVYVVPPLVKKVAAPSSSQTPTSSTTQTTNSQTTTESTTSQTTTSQTTTSQTTTSETTTPQTTTSTSQTTNSQTTESQDTTSQTTNSTTQSASNLSTSTDASVSLANSLRVTAFLVASTVCWILG